jgi:hypothetical protein
MKSFFGLGGKDKGDDASVEDDNSDAAPADGDAATGEEGQATNATEGDAAGKADDAKDAANATGTNLLVCATKITFNVCANGVGVESGPFVRHF